MKRVLEQSVHRLAVTDPDAAKVRILELLANPELSQANRNLLSIQLNQLGGNKMNRDERKAELVKAIKGLALTKTNLALRNKLYADLLMIGGSQQDVDEPEEKEPDTERVPPSEHIEKPAAPIPVKRVARKKTGKKVTKGAS